MTWFPSTPRRPSEIKSWPISKKRWTKPAWSFGAVEERGKRKRGYKELVDLGILEIEALTYIRGRSIPKQYMIVDEAQNLTPHEIKTIITQAGEGTKIVRNNFV